MTEISTSWHTFPKGWALGHSALKELFWDEVHIEEKVDGSQFSFGRFGDELKCRSKGQEIYLDGYEGMFAPAVEAVKNRFYLLKDGWTYRAEFLAKPKHNILAYARIPKDTLIIFDINKGQEDYLSFAEKQAEADHIELECVPLLSDTKIDGIDAMNALLEIESVLGGQKSKALFLKTISALESIKKC